MGRLTVATDDSAVSAMDAAQGELRALDAILASTDGGPPAASALLRAWYALAVLDAALGQSSVPSYADFLEALGREDAGTAWVGEHSLDVAGRRALVVAISRPALPRREWPSDRDVLRQRNALVSWWLELQGQVRERHLRRPSWRTRWRIVLAACFAVAVLSVGMALALRPPVWRVQFFRTPNLVDPVASDLTVDIGGHWGLGSPHYAVPEDDFSSRWESCMVLDRPHDVVFRLGSDDGSRLAIDGRNVIDQWKGQPYTEQMASVRLAAGVHYVRVEHFELTGTADLSLRARFEGDPAFRAVPRTMLRAPRPGPTPCGP
jgi:hypothetical protein